MQIEQQTSDWNMKACVAVYLCWKRQRESQPSLFWKIDLAKYIHLFNKYLTSLLDQILWEVQRTPVLGWPKSSLRFVHTLFQKSPNNFFCPALKKSLVLPLWKSVWWTVGDGEPMIDSVCPLCAQMVPGSLRREGIPEPRLAGPAKISWGTARSGLREPHVRECLK